MTQEILAEFTPQNRSATEADYSALDSFNGINYKDLTIDVIRTHGSKVVAAAVVATGAAIMVNNPAEAKSLLDTAKETVQAVNPLQEDTPQVLQDTLRYTWQLYRYGWPGSIIGGLGGLAWEIADGGKRGTIVGTQDGGGLPERKGASVVEMAWGATTGAFTGTAAWASGHAIYDGIESESIPLIAAGAAPYLTWLGYRLQLLSKNKVNKVINQLTKAQQNLEHRGLLKREK